MSEGCCEENLVLTDSQKVKIINAVAHELKMMGILSVDSLRQGDYLEASRSMIRELRPVSASSIPFKVFKDISKGSSGTITAEDAIKVAKAICAVADVVCPFVKEL